MEDKIKAYAIMIGSAVAYGIYFLGLGRLLEICMTGNSAFSEVARVVLDHGIGTIIVYILFWAPVCFIPWKSVQWSDKAYQSSGARFIVFGGLLTAVAGVYVIITKFSDMPLMFLIYGIIVLVNGIMLCKKRKQENTTNNPLNP